ncbi:MAG: PilZ domain-containing protein [Firmicutes bacterium]|nr:PilZ domain-containing protein [Bacillota bacterium]
MSVFNLFGKKEQPSRAYKEQDETLEAEIYSGMRVEVTDQEGKLLFVAKMECLRGKEAELHQYSESTLSKEEPLRAKIRGYSDHDRKAVYMEAIIRPRARHVWDVEELNVVRVANDRAFFRLDTDLDASITMFSGLMMGERPCKMLNISVGGARLISEYQYHEGDKFLLRVKLIDDRPESVMYCQVLRAVEQEEGQFEYGCQFLELTEDDQERIIQNIFEAQSQIQRQKKANS